MKKQRFALYLVAVLCFVVCFVILNRKYDRFYRINGINNENRLLITQYLTEEEQQYLVENSFPMNRFSRFLMIEDFHLQDLEYYEQIEMKKQWQSKPKETILYTNQLLEKIRNDTGGRVDTVFTMLFNSELLDCYIHTDDFKIDLFDLYEVHYEITESIESKDVQNVNHLAEIMDSYHYSKREQVEFLKKWEDQYTLNDLVDYFTLKNADPNLELVENPQSLTVIMKDGQTIASYEPSPLTIPYSVSRTRFACYLRQDASAALEELSEAVNKAIADETLLLVDGYASYETLSTEYANQQSSIRPGSSEYQLGLTVDLMALEILYDQFDSTTISDYLKEHSWEYGFIQRYPDEKSALYSANTYRFVGKDAAKVMHEKNLTLEEYEGISHE